MDRRAVEAPGEELHAVACVDDKCVRDVAHPAPFAVRGEDLQRGDGLRVEDGDRAEVGVAFQPDVLGEGLFLSCAWVAWGGCRYFWDAKNDKLAIDSLLHEAHFTQDPLTPFVHE